MGLCFSIPKTTAVPPSLKHIYLALEKDSKVTFKTPAPVHGDLSNWAKQGVLMLNAILTVNSGKSDSHKDSGWMLFTKAVLDAINKKKEGVSFLVWGKKAEKIAESIDKVKHNYMYFGHPSPLGLGKKFDECKHFSLTNEYLEKKGSKLINW